MKRVLFALLFTIGLSLQIYPSNSFEIAILDKYTLNKYSKADTLDSDFDKEFTLFCQLKSQHNITEIFRQATILKNELIRLKDDIQKQLDTIKKEMSHDSLNKVITTLQNDIQSAQEIEMCQHNQTGFMLKCYQAVGCGNRSYIDRFNKIKKRCNITEQIQLFENMPNNENTAAFYQPFCQAVCINKKDFSIFSKTEIDFVFYHELRHHLQYTTAQAKAKVQQYEKSLRLTSSQAMEYDADMFALEKIAKKQCPHCFQELKNLRYNPGLNQNYDSEGYITSFAIEPYLQKAKAHPKICKYHSNPHNQPSMLSSIWNASKSPNCQNYSSLICATIALKTTHFMESRNYPTPNATKFRKI